MRKGGTQIKVREEQERMTADQIKKKEEREKQKRGKKG